MKIVVLEHVMLVSHLARLALSAQCLKPLNGRCKHKNFFLSVSLHFYAIRLLQMCTKTVRLLALIFYER